MNVTLEFWEKGNAKLTRSYLIITEETAVELFDEKFVARITPAASNFPPGAPFDPIYGTSDFNVKDRAVSAIRGRPENAGLRSFEKKS
jgi:hypothetical protein